MKKNVGSFDKVIRLIIAAVIAILFIANVLTFNTLGIIILIAGIAMLLTGLFNFCGLYSIFGINTCKRK
jgi:hypothetical protein